MRAATKEMAPMLLRWSEVDVGESWQQKLNLPIDIPSHFVAV